MDERDWMLRAITWWENNSDRVIMWVCVFVAGMIVGACVGFAQ